MVTKVRFFNEKSGVPFRGITLYLIFFIINVDVYKTLHYKMKQYNIDKFKNHIVVVYLLVQKEESIYSLILRNETKS